MRYCTLLSLFLSLPTLSHMWQLPTTVSVDAHSSYRHFPCHFPRQSSPLGKEQICPVFGVSRFAGASLSFPPYVT
jgi:hypothetical protein